MNRPTRSQPLAPISANIVSSPPVPLSKHRPTNVVDMDARITQYGEGSDTHTGSLDALDDVSLDSAFERQMLMEMRAEREAIETRRIPRKPFSRAEARPELRVTAEQLNQVSPAAASRPAETREGTRPRIRKLDAHGAGQSHLSQTRTWGSRAKRGMNFLENYRQTVHHTPQIDNSEAVDWRSAVADADADTPLPSSEDSPLSRKTSTRTTPASGHKVKDQSYEKVLSWNVSPGFSAHSLLASTPAPAKRNLHLESVHRAELDDAAENEQLFTPPPQSVPTTGKPQVTSGVGTRPPARHGRAEGARNAPASKVSSSATAADAGDDAQDSLSVLRRLSRSVSATPTAPKVIDAGKPDRSKADKDGAAAVARSTDSKNPPAIAERKPFGRALDRNMDAQHLTSLGQQEKTPRISGGFDDTLPSQNPELASKSTVPKTSNDKPRSIFDIFSFTAQRQKHPPLAASPPKPAQPNLPQSALSAILGRAKSDANDGLGDATIHSLEEIIEPEDSTLDLAGTELPPPRPHPLRRTGNDFEDSRDALERRLLADLPFGDGLAVTVEEQKLIRDIVDARMKREAQSKTQLSKHSGPRRAPLDDQATLTPRSKDRLAEDLQLQRMSDQVNTMHSRARTISEGLGRLERSITTGAGGCKHCGCPGTCYGATPWYALIRSATALFYRDDKGRRQITWLGWTVILFALWVVAELGLCYQYCRPVFADYISESVGFDFYSDVPEPPLVTLTLLYRPVQSLFHYPITVLSAFFSWIWNLFWYLLEIDESQPVPTRASSFISSATARLMAQTLVPASDWSMDADELI